MNSASPPAPHVILVDRRWNCASETLAPETIEPIEAALRGGPWYRDRYSRAKFRTALVETLRRHAPSGLVVLGPGVPFDIPPPFLHFFEPIPLRAEDERLKTLSGESPTRHERSMRALRWIFGTMGVVLLMLLALGIRQGSGELIAALVVGAVVALALLLGAAKNWIALTPTWYLLPASVAIVGRRRVRAVDRLKVHTRFDSCVVFRLVNAGKVIALMLEVVSADGCRRTSVNDRDAISFLAAWQSPVPPPSREKLGELFG